MKGKTKQVLERCGGGGVEVGNDCLVREGVNYNTPFEHRFEGKKCMGEPHGYLDKEHSGQGEEKMLCFLDIYLQRC